MSQARQTVVVKVRVDPALCQGHGRCYATAPEVFEADDIGNGHEVGDGSVPADLEHKARVAVANCPELAINIEEAG